MRLPDGVEPCRGGHAAPTGLSEPLSLPGRYKNIAPPELVHVPECPTFWPLLTRVYNCKPFGGGRGEVSEARENYS